VRFHDELVLTFRGQDDLELRRFVLRQMMDLPVNLDTPELVEAET